MILVSYRAIRDRFTHIDADLVGIQFAWPGEDATYTVRFYPWWEHPLYQAAIKAGQPWKFTDVERESREITVTVYARGVRQLHLSRRLDVIDWDFLDDHPLLWPYHDAEQVHLDSSLSPDQITRFHDLLRETAESFGYPNLWADSAHFADWVMKGPFYDWMRGGSCTLGPFPKPLFDRVTHFLEEIGAEHLVYRVPALKADLPKLFVVDGEDYIIADDFEVDLPVVIHKDVYFLER